MSGLPETPRKTAGASATRRLLLLVVYLVLLVMGLSFIADLWFDVMSWRVVGKLVLTLLVLAGLLAAWLSIRAHIRAEKVMTRDKYLN